MIAISKYVASTQTFFKNNRYATSPVRFNCGLPVISTASSTAAGLIGNCTILPALAQRHGYPFDSKSVTITKGNASTRPRLAISYGTRSGSSRACSKSTASWLLASVEVTLARKAFVAVVVETEVAVEQALELGMLRTVVVE